MKQKLALEASAGSGKTFALSVRYVALMLTGAHPSKIVALTFTKKAANEMKERIHATLRNLAHRPAELHALEQMLETSSQEVLALGKKALRVYEEAPLAIETIDAYIARILRKFSLYEGILPDFSIRAEPEHGALLEGFLKEVKGQNRLVSLAKFAATLRLSQRDIFSLFELLYEKECELEGFLFPALPHPNPQEVMEVAGEIHDFLVRAGTSQRGCAPFGAKELKSLLEKSFWGRESLEYWDYKKIYTPQLDALFVALKEAYGHYAKAREGFLLGELMALYGIYVQGRRALATQRNELTFTDVTNSVYRLLQGGLEKEFLYFRLDGSVEHLLIDEFQDTNVAQCEILSPLIEEIVAGVGTKGGRSFFYVGDVKQSIYRFRGGSQALFYELAQRFDVSVEALSTNYRSKENVVAFVNHVFASRIERYIPQRTLQEAAGGMVRVVHEEDVLRGVVQEVGALLEAGVQAEMMAVLTQINDDAVQVKEALLEAFPSLHVSTHSTVLLRDNPWVKALLECAKYSYFGDPLYWHGVQTLAASAVAPRTFAFDAPLEVVFGRMVEYLALDGSSEEIIAFLEAVALSEDIEALLFDLERFDAKAPTQNHGGLKVLTVHKSKGLEFEYVVVCDRIKGENNRSEPLLFSYEGSKLVGIFAVQKQREHVDEGYALAKTKEQARQEEDRLNAHYVAFTRGKRGLIVVHKTEKSTFEALGLSPCAIGEVELVVGSSEDAVLPIQTPRPLKALGAQEKPLRQEGEGTLFARAFGQALHEALEWMPAFESHFIPLALERLKQRYGNVLHQEAWEALAWRIKRLVCHEEFRRLVSLGEVRKEQPLMYKGEQRQLDVLVTCKEKMVVIDYKSGLKQAKTHEAQVLLYKEAMEHIGGKPVEAWLFYLGAKEIEAINL